jgi:hypothetical protein
LPLDGVALCPERRKPFNPSTEELPLEKIRGDKTAIELFLREIRGLEAGVRRKTEDGNL